MDSLVYHGSHERFGEAVPKRQVRTRDGQVIFDRESFHATPHRDIALAYTARPPEAVTTGISLYHREFEVIVFGHGKTLEEYLDELYGTGGYLLGFDPKDFQWMEGLGSLEVAALENVRPVNIERVNDPVAEMLAAGVRFQLVDTLKKRRE